MVKIYVRTRKGSIMPSLHDLLVIGGKNKTPHKLKIVTIVSRIRIKQENLYKRAVFVVQLVFVHVGTSNSSQKNSNPRSSVCSLLRVVFSVAILSCTISRMCFKKSGTPAYSLETALLKRTALKYFTISRQRRCVKRRACALIMTTPATCGFQVVELN